MVFHHDDADLHYEVHGTGEPLLWLHGSLGVGDDWHFLFPDPPAGYRLIAPDLRGHGRSDGAAHTYSFAQTARDMLALLDHLHLGSVNVIGLSGGGISALHLARLDPARVSAIVAISAPPRFPAQARAIQRAYCEELLPPAEREMMRRRHARPGQLATLFTQINRMADGNDPNFTRSDCAAITMPTLIVFGDRDPLYPVSLACELHEMLPNSWLWVVPNGGHAPVFGDAAPTFAETARRFLAGGFNAAAAPRLD